MKEKEKEKDDDDVLAWRVPVPELGPGSGVCSCSSIVTSGEPGEPVSTYLLPLSRSVPASGSPP